MSSKIHVCSILTVIYGEVKEQLSITASAHGHLSAFVLLFTRYGVQGQVKVQAWRKGHGGGEGEENHTSCGSYLKELGFLAHLQDADLEQLIGRELAPIRLNLLSC